MPTPQIFLPLAATPKAQTGVSIITAATTDFYMHRMQGSGTVNDAISFDFASDAGTYTFVLFHRRGTNVGIYTVQIDGSSVGTIDGFNGSSLTTRSTITGLVLAAGVHTLQLQVLTKNASSTGFFFAAVVAHFLQTA